LGSLILSQTAVFQTGTCLNIASGKTDMTKCQCRLARQPYQGKCICSVSSLKFYCERKQSVADNNLILSCSQGVVSREKIVTHILKTLTNEQLAYE